jgi:type VI secretion system secreted protein VgrG
MAETRIQLACAALPDGCRPVGFSGHEAINEISRWTVDVLCADPEADLDGAVGSAATLAITDEIEGTTRRLSLLVADVSYADEGNDGHFFTLTLAPTAHLLTLQARYRIFQKLTTKQIVEKVLKDAGVPADQILFRLSGVYLARLHCVQYGETDWAFIERLLADEGISYWFDEHDDQGPRLVLGDSPGSHDGVTGGRIPYEDASGMVGARHLFELEVAEEVTTTAVHVRDYDVRQPEVYLEGKAGSGALEHFEYPACVLTGDAATARAKARLEQLQRFKVRAEGRGDCLRLQAGRVVTVEGCADEKMNRAYLIVRVEHALTVGSRADQRMVPYRNQVVLVPSGEVAFRPDLPRAVPRVEGVETAVTTGPAGQEIHVDDLGRVKLQFPWDRAGITDDKSSTWVRCLQMSMGFSMLLPRVGWEVPVVYVDGNPDRPFVLGRLYNATQVLPYGLPGAAATTTLQSATSPGGGTTNEFRMGDGAGKQEMFLHASKDCSVTVGGSATTSVSVDETHDVGLSLALGVKGSQSHVVGAKQSLNVGADYSIGVKGGRTEMVGGLELNKITGNRKVTAKGAYGELVGGLYGIQANQSNTMVKGAFTQLIGGSMSLAGGLGNSESVAAMRTELVGGSRTIKSATEVTDNVTGAKSVTAGACTEKAGAEVVTDVTGAMSVKIGGSASLTASQPLVLKAPSIKITVGGSITAGALEMGGGKLSTKKGTTKLKGNIKRQSGSKVG